MADPDVSSNPTEFQKVAMAAAELEPTVTAYLNFKDVSQQLEEAKEMLREECTPVAASIPVARDPQRMPSWWSWRAMEIMSLTKQLEALEEQLKVLLLPRDPLDDKNIMLEVQQHVSLLLLSYKCTYKFARVPVARRPRCGQPTL